MNTTTSQIHAVPTNIVTGFLGVGKTSAILQLLSQKSVNERWAILVNEFGEIGVDGSLFEGQHAENQGVFIREVPGGCMCCTSGLPMEIALNQLLRRANPDRLLIEPTGLGHPKEVLELLAAQHYQDVLSIQKTLTLVDARKLIEPRYTDHDTYNQQIEIADTIVANKVDLYSEGDKARLLDYVSQQGISEDSVLFTEYGQIPIAALEGSTAHSASAVHHHTHESDKKPLALDLPIPDCGFIKASNQGQGFHSVGWRFSPDKVFDREKLFLLLTGITAERIKAVFITDDGVFGYNAASDALTEIELDDCLESRIEIISDSIDDSLEVQLLNCMVA
ncbi:MAG: CobW family GTP-binding protein [Porticoccaceae bacterium]